MKFRAAQMPDFAHDDHSRRRLILWSICAAVTILLLALLGFVSSFFSDWLGGEQASAIGVTELREGEFSLTHYSEGDLVGDVVFREDRAANVLVDSGSIDADGVLEDFNPGDSLELSFDVDNAGAKSVWYRTLLTVTVRMASAVPADVVGFYSPKLCVWQLDEESDGGPAKFTQATAMVSDADVSCKGDVPGMSRVGFEVVSEGDAANDGDPLTVQLRASSLDGVLSADPTAQDAEVEACGVADCPSQARVRYGVYFNPDVVDVNGVAFDDNEWQGARYGFDYAAQAIQYRNVDSPDWDGTAIEPYHDDYDDSVLRWDYAMTGSAQTFTAPVDGVYQLEAWGAKGGTVTGHGANGLGGAGAYARGNLYLKRGQSIYVYVGQHGEGARKGSGNHPGTFNGGGATGIGGTYLNGGSGGGSTDFRLVSGSWDDVQGLNSRILAAAGGGGGSGDDARSGSPDGGPGGRVAGVDGAFTYSQTQGQARYSTPARGGSQVAGGVPSKQNGTADRGYSGVFGAGGSGFNSDFTGGSGGGGWYGGGAGGDLNYGMGSGAGGSSFISGYPGAVALSDTSAANAGNPRTHRPSTDSPVDRATQVIDGREYRFTGYAMAAGDESMPDWGKSDGSLMTGNAGDGHARITLL
ncbi:MAG: glycine rich domain-containing protein [Bifidobacterium sp.]|uniref:glycine rich domain-containing protein n=1 Tax=Bifidobacterium sp. TaxID=41200 RepID=UPI0039E75CDF